jgi:hypothetical protein
MDEVRTRHKVAPVSSAEATAELIAVIVAVTDGEPRVLTIDDGDALPSGPFELTHRSLQSGMRSWVERQTHHPLGYVEQLYTFADRDRTRTGQRMVAISYLGLTREARGSGEPGVGWQSWYRYFPWEDRRSGISAAEEPVAAKLRGWADGADDAVTRRERQRRIGITFGQDGRTWNEELILQRYELLWEAGLVPEAPRHSAPVEGHAMTHDHRRILATGIARLRAKIKYRPVVFELMPPRFTLLQLQQAVEALAGRRLHKQNLRRLIEQQDLVLVNDAATTETRGRPAAVPLRPRCGGGAGGDGQQAAVGTVGGLATSRVSEVARAGPATASAGRATSNRSSGNSTLP